MFKNFIYYGWIDKDGTSTWILIALAYAMVQLNYGLIGILFSTCALIATLLIFSFFVFVLSNGFDILCSIIIYVLFTLHTLLICIKWDGKIILLVLHLEYLSFEWFWHLVLHNKWMRSSLWLASLISRSKCKITSKC